MPRRVERAGDGQLEQRFRLPTSARTRPTTPRCCHTRHRHLV
jgi:hypothetical protein